MKFCTEETMTVCGIRIKYVEYLHMIHKTKVIGYVAVEREAIKLYLGGPLILKRYRVIAMWHSHQC